MAGVSLLAGIAICSFASFADVTAARAQDNNAAMLPQVNVVAPRHRRPRTRKVPPTSKAEAPSSIHLSFRPTAGQRWRVQERAGRRPQSRSVSR
jgi:hypothetical protein